jgi:CRP/FNR family transcriptional regulator, cyclic AMP receptor protein
MTDHNLKNISILAALAPEQCAQIAQSCTVQTCHCGMQIVTEDDSSTDIFFILCGRVAIKSFSAQGYEVVYAELTEGACFGEFSAIDGAPRAATAEALNTVSIARLSSAHLRAFMLMFPPLGLALAEHLVARARALSERIFEFSTLPVQSRVRLELLRLARSAPPGQDWISIKPAPTHQELAARISTHREAVSRELSQLGTLKLVQAGRKTIDISSIRALRQSIRQ